jgi:hypothetical protein
MTGWEIYLSFSKKGSGIMAGHIEIVNRKSTSAEERELISFPVWEIGDEEIGDYAVCSL